MPVHNLYAEGKNGLHGRKKRWFAGAPRSSAAVYALTKTYEIRLIAMAHPNRIT
ncbi:MAG: hypothetical protein PVI90_01740 [Desulfobacteraceae bacterium]